MYMNTGYLNHSHMDFKDKSRPLVVEVAVLTAFPAIQSYQPTVKGTPGLSDYLYHCWLWAFSF